MRDDFRISAVSCHWISMQTIALLYPKCAISQAMKSERSISNELQYSARLNRNFEEHFFIFL